MINELPVIDAHQHFWEYEESKHSWIDDEMADIRRDFLPHDLAPVLEANGIDGCVAVQADQTEAETNFLINLASKHPFIKAVVGWVDLRAEDISERLQHYAFLKVVKGFRHVLQGEEPAFMLQSSFVRGIAALQNFNFTYDILVFPKHLKAAKQLVQQFPDQRFVIDHIAKPYIREGLVDEWKRDIKSLAVFPNVFCKVSGMVTETNYKSWRPEDFHPYLNVVTAAFGTNRIMYGSDWPVCQVAASYQQTMSIVKDYYKAFSETEQQSIFGKNAIDFYQID